MNGIADTEFDSSDNIPYIVKMISGGEEDGEDENIQDVSAESADDDDDNNNTSRDADIRVTTSDDGYENESGVEEGTSVADISDLPVVIAGGRDNSTLGLSCNEGSEEQSSPKKKVMTKKKAKATDAPKLRTKTFVEKMFTRLTVPKRSIVYSRKERMFFSQHVALCGQYTKDLGLAVFPRDKNSVFHTIVYTSAFAMYTDVFDFHVFDYTKSVWARGVEESAVTECDTDSVKIQILTVSTMLYNLSILLKYCKENSIMYNVRLPVDKDGNMVASLKEILNTDTLMISVESLAAKYFLYLVEKLKLKKDTGKSNARKRKQLPESLNPLPISSSSSSSTKQQQQAVVSLASTSPSHSKIARVNSVPKKEVVAAARGTFEMMNGSNHVIKSVKNKMRQGSIPVIGSNRLSRFMPSSSSVAGAANVSHTRYSMESNTVTCSTLETDTCGNNVVNSLNALMACSNLTASGKHLITKALADVYLIIAHNGKAFRDSV